MLKFIKARMQQGHRTTEYPDGAAPALPPRFMGRPVLDPARCGACRGCAEICPVGALEAPSEEGRLGGHCARIDLGKCVFCGTCRACPNGAVTFTGDHRLAVRKREHLVVDSSAYALAEALDEKARSLFGRSLKLRQVSAGGCNACEADCNVLTTVGWDLGRFGIQFVASPRHADGILVTGPVPKNMRLGLEKTWQAVPGPKLVIAVGACAIGGGPYAGHEEVHNGAGSTVPVDLYIPGCPPHPLTILDGLLRLLGRV